MAEYKDVEQIKKRVREDCNGCWNRNSPDKCPDDCGVIEAIRAIDSVPPVDAVQVVMTKAEIIDYLYDIHTHADYSIEDIAEDLAVPVVHGQWIGDAYSLRCSACGHDLMDYFSYTEEGQIVEQPNFCPHCKADMRKGNSDG